jgi:hypothetical protein
VQVKKDLFHMLQIYDRCIVQDHVLRKPCILALNQVFFGDSAERTKETVVPAGSVLGPLLQAWYLRWSAHVGLFKSTMAAKHSLQLTHVRNDCVSDPPDVKVVHVAAAWMVLCLTQLIALLAV